jgi:ferredoxin-NADP reductase
MVDAVLRRLRLSWGSAFEALHRVLELDMSDASFQVRVKSISWEAQGINSYELRALNGSDLPPFTAGSHIDLQLPNGLVRSYSLLNSQAERHRYVVAVNKDPASRGGSRYMHEVLKAGDVVTVTGPRNNFSLKEDAAHSVFVAGGIGVTPLLSMLRRLEDLGRSWELFYCGRTRQSTAFLGELKTLGDKVTTSLHFNFDKEPGGQMLDIAAALAGHGDETHFYCCGPVPMLTAFEAATANRPSANVHVEYFTAKEAPAADGGFVVELAKSGRTFEITKGKTILDVLLDAGITVPFSCMEGACGQCQTRVIEGTPDHRDVYLSKEEHEANDTMMVCCSGCKGGRLVLDL